MRLDKLLANSGFGTRTEVKKLIRYKAVTINGEVAKSGSTHVDEVNDEVAVYEEPVVYLKNIYLMMNKPKDVVSATQDNIHETVIDLVDEGLLYFDLFPVGRLDIDTEGFLILTNDGQFSHRVLSPNKHVPKMYYLETDEAIPQKAIEAFTKGVPILDGYVTKPAVLEILSETTAHLTITEGKYHQVKEMMLTQGVEVTYLKRVKYGNLELDSDLALGEYRLIEEEELAKIFE